MIDLYDLFVSFPEDEGVESIATVDLAKFFEDLELNWMKCTLTANGSF